MSIVSSWLAVPPTGVNSRFVALLPPPFSGGNRHRLSGDNSHGHRLQHSNIDNVYGRGYETFPLPTQFRNLLIVTASTE